MKNINHIEIFLKVTYLRFMMKFAMEKIYLQNFKWFSQLELEYKKKQTKIHLTTILPTNQF